MTPQHLTGRMADLAHRAALLDGSDPALRTLLEEMEALAQLLPTPQRAAAKDMERDDLFDNMPV